MEVVSNHPEVAVVAAASVDVGAVVAVEETVVVEEDAVALEGV